MSRPQAMITPHAAAPANAFLNCQVPVPNAFSVSQEVTQDDNRRLPDIVRQQILMAQTLFGYEVHVV